MTDAYSASAWFELMGLAALIGAGGQGVRVIVGLKKLSDAASSEPGKKTSDLLVPSQLTISLVIGAIAGGIAAATTMVPGAGISAQQLAALAAAGYAGADFVEGFMTRALPASGDAAGQGAVGTGEPAAPAPEKGGAEG
jgi:hypothetical protein